MNGLAIQREREARETQEREEREHQMAQARRAATRWAGIRKDGGYNMQYAIQQFGISLAGTLTWGACFIGLAMLLSRLPVWYAVRRELTRDRRMASTWHPEELPLSAGSAPYRGKGMVR